MLSLSKHLYRFVELASNAFSTRTQSRLNQHKLPFMKPTSTNYYYKYDNQEDDLFGEGFAYIEFGSNLQPLRQVDDYGSILLYSYIDTNTKKMFGTSYLSELELNPALEEYGGIIDAEIFERKWQQAHLFNDKRLNIDLRWYLTESIFQEIIANQPKQ